MKNLITTIVLTLGVASLTAQNSVDALRYSQRDYQGSAKFVGMGGSAGALGGEISGLTINPAGIGVYRNSEFTISSGFNNYNSELTYLGTQREDGRLNFNLPNIAYVGSYKGDPEGWKNYSFGINYNRISSFNSESFLRGDGSNSTIIDDYVNTLNADNAGVGQVQNFAYPFGPSQAFNLLLIDTLTNANTGLLGYIPYIFLDEFLGNGRTVDNISQERTIQSSGNQSETQITFGGNYQDKLYLGGSISYETFFFDQEFRFSERYTYSPVAQPTDSFLVTDYTESSQLEVRGRGVNFKIGAIYKVTDQLRIGGSIHSPSLFGVNEVFLFDASSTFASGQTFRADSITSNFEYRITTPTRYNASLAYLFGPSAAINVDYEYVNFSTAQFNDRQGFETDFSASNQEIEEVLEAGHNVRVGAEIKLNPFILRGGFNYESNPYSSLSALEGGRTTYSLGGGFRNKNFNLDVALSRRFSEISQPVYAAADSFAEINETETNLVFTVGWRW